MVQRQFELICPGEKRVIYRKTMKVCFCVFGTAIVLFALIFMKHHSIYNLLLAVFFICVSALEIVRYTTGRLERKLLKQLEGFLLDVRHYYYTTHSVSEAVLESTTKAGYEMRVHANLIYEVLISADIKTEVKKYNSGTQNSFLKLFLTQCVNAIEYGDQVINQESMFIANMGDLQRDIQNYLLKVDAFRFAFSGLSIVGVLPILSLGAIRSWGISNLPELQSFYDGQLGIALIIVFFVLTVLAYMMIVKMQEVEAEQLATHPILYKLAARGLIARLLTHYEKNHYSRMQNLRKMLRRMGESRTPKMLLLEQMIFAITVCLIGSGVVCYSHFNERYHLCRVVDNAESLTSTASAEQILVMQEKIIDYVSRYQKAKEVTVEQISQELLQEMVFRNNLIIEATANEIVSRVEQYQNSYIKWYEVLIILICSVIAYQVPYLLILYKKKLMQMSMSSEVMQFQSIILMLMYIPDMTVLTLLETMEDFSVIFKVSIQECINEYSYSGEKALEELKEKETFEPFQRLIDHFIICDRIGIVKAFDEVSQDRMHFQERQKLNTEKLLKDKSLIAQITAFTPVTLIIAFYLIIPFAVECIRQFTGSWAEMKMMSP